jgi:putative colanic acid polymerase
MGLIVALVAVRSPGRTLPVAGIATAIAIPTVGSYLANRLNSTYTVGSSANYRLIAPQEILQDVLSKDLLGRPLGSIQETVGSYGSLNGIETGTSLDNGFYVIIYYMGWVGVCVLLALALLTVRGAFRPQGHFRSIALVWLIPPWLLGSLLFSGGIVLPEFVITTVLLLAVYKGGQRPLRESRFSDTNFPFTHSLPESHAKDS